jgi:lysophospholipase L1-like esterase
MKYLVSISIVCLGLLYFFTPAERYIKTFLLILQTSPYERVIDEAPQILVLGDSTGYGTGVNNPRDSVPGLIGRDFPNYTIVNNSRNGRTIGELVSVAEAVSGNYQLILLQIGANDIVSQRNSAEVESELRYIVEILAEHTPHIVMISSGNVGGAATFNAEQAELYTRLTREFRERYSNVGDETNLHYVDLFLEPEDDIMSQNPEKYLAWDGFHPSAAGYALWYERLRPVLEDKLSTSAAK